MYTHFLEKIGWYPSKMGGETGGFKGDFFKFSFFPPFFPSVFEKILDLPTLSTVKSVWLLHLQSFIIKLGLLYKGRYRL